MIDILLQPASGVLSVQHTSVSIVTDSPIATANSADQTDEGQPLLSRNLITNDLLHFLDQTTDAPYPSLPTIVGIDSMQPVRKTVDGPTHPTNHLIADAILSIGQNEGPLPPPPSK